jgi:hypothetical protein
MQTTRITVVAEKLPLTEGVLPIWVCRSGSGVAVFGLLKPPHGGCVVDWGNSFVISLPSALCEIFAVLLQDKGLGGPLNRSGLAGGDK